MYLKLVRKIVPLKIDSLNKGLKKKKKKKKKKKLSFQCLCMQNIGDSDWI